MSDQDPPEFELIAYRHKFNVDMRIVPAVRQRQWMNETANHFANRCLPMLIANQAGWVILNPERFQVIWEGGNEESATAFRFLDSAPAHAAINNFAHGIVTFTFPYMFRTPPGWNLWVRGPANMPKDSIAPLEGIVETDWMIATFTMNWKFTRPNVVVTFEKDEPICMLVPIRTELLETFSPVIADIGDEPEIQEELHRWGKSRWEFVSSLKEGEPDSVERGWQKHYFRGTDSQGNKTQTHRQKLTIREFSER